ncbi:MAG: hypothetical protein ACJ72R_14575 [Nitrososphaeraceae archaeon]
MPECEFFQPSLYPEMLPLLNDIEHHSQLLTKSLLLLTETEEDSSEEEEDEINSS